MIKEIKLIYHLPYLKSSFFLDFVSVEIKIKRNVVDIWKAAVGHCLEVIAVAPEWQLEDLSIVRVL